MQFLNLLPLIIIKMMKRILGYIIWIVSLFTSFAFSLNPWDISIQQRNSANTANLLQQLSRPGTWINGLIWLNGTTTLPQLMRLATWVNFDGSWIWIGNLPFSSISWLNNTVIDLQSQISSSTGIYAYVTWLRTDINNNISSISWLVLSGFQQDFITTGIQNNISIINSTISSIQSTIANIQFSLTGVLASITDIQVSGALIQYQISWLQYNMTWLQAFTSGLNFTVTWLQALVNTKQNALSGSTSDYVRGDWSYFAFPTLLSQFTNNLWFLTGLSLPTFLSQLTNNVGFITWLALNSYFLIPTGGIAQYLKWDWTLGTSITNISQLTNNVWYITGVTITQTGVTRTLNSGFVISNTKNAMVTYSVRINASAALLSPAEGAVILEIASDSGFTSNVQEVGRIENADSVSIILTLTQSMSSQLMGFVPAWYWTRLRTVQTTGAPTFAWKSGQEILIW